MLGTKARWKRAATDQADRFLVFKHYGRWHAIGLVGLLLATLGPVRAVAQPTEPLPSPRTASPASSDASQNPASDGSGLPISLPAAMQLALTSNLQIAQAREAVFQAQARLDRAKVTILPNFNIGSAYNQHDGNIQKTEGNIIKVNRDSLFTGGGPSLSFSMTEALFGPLAARQLTAATRAGVQRVDQETLFAVADAYLSVLRARRRIARINETLRQLTSEQPSPLRAQAKGMLPLIESFVKSGAKEALPADLERVRVEVLRRRDELIGAVDELRLATAELARLLRLDPAAPLDPVEDFRVLLPFADTDRADRPLAELVEIALRNRPDLAENRALVEAALARVRAAQYRPFLPNAGASYSWGDFGGGPDLNAPLRLPPLTPGGPPRIVTVPGNTRSGTIRHFAPRDDFDASLFWRLDNLGLGNRAELREQRSIHRGTILRQQQVEDQVVTQVVQARELAQAWRERVNIARQTLFNAEGAPRGPAFRSVTLSFDRIVHGEGRPLELLDSIRGLSDSLEAYGQAMTDLERAHIRLLFALGFPLQDLAETPPPAASPRR